MNKHARYEKRTEELVEPMAQVRNFELVDVEFLKEAGSWHLRVYLDKEGGITIDDLAEVNRELSDVMDREDYIEESYILEVRSPGLLRPFKKPKDFLRNIGQEVELKLFQPFTWEENGQKFSSKELEGTLVSYEDSKITLAFEENEKLVFDVKDIALIRKAIDF